MLYVASSTRSHCRRTTPATQFYNLRKPSIFYFNTHKKAENGRSSRTFEKFLHVEINKRKNECVLSTKSKTSFRKPRIYFMNENLFTENLLNTFIFFNLNPTKIICNTIKHCSFFFFFLLIFIRFR